MKLGIMQPYFFPYIGYFDLINSVDKWIVFDTAQYIRHGWINRNRILHPQDGWQYIIVPLKKHSRSISIKDVEINNNQDWKQRIIGQLQHYKKNAPYFKNTLALLDECLASEEKYISRLNVLILEKTCALLDIRFDYSYFSEMDLKLDSIEKPGDWALRISQALGAVEYVNPPGGVDIFDRKRFTNSGIKLTIRTLPTFEYSCYGYDFIPNLSIVDILMWNEPDKIKKFLDLHRTS